MTDFERYKKEFSTAKILENYLNVCHKIIVNNNDNSFTCYWFNLNGQLEDIETWEE